MRVKVVTLDFHLTQNAKWAIRWGVLPLAVLLGAMAVAHAYDTSWIASSQPVSAAKLKADLDEAQTRLAALESEVAKLAAQAHAASSFSSFLTAPAMVPNNVSGLPVKFDRVQFDLGSEYDATTGTFTPKQSGTYFAHCVLEFVANASADYAVGFFVNGAPAATGDLVVDNQGAISVQVNELLHLSAGDAVTCLPFQNTGGAVSLDEVAGSPRNTFSAARIY
jgi:hypothetical protein